MDYAELTSQHQFQVVTNRLAQYEGRHFEAMLNLQVAEAAGDKASVQKAQDTLDAMETAITVTKKQLAEFPKPDPAHGSDQPYIPG